MGRLIDEDELMLRLKEPIQMDEDKAERLWEGWHECTIAVERAIRNTPTVELKPKTARWIKQNPLVDTEECSNCGYNILSEEMETPYCPWCGYAMKGDK